MLTTMELLNWINPDVQNISEKITLTFKLDSIVGEVKAAIEAHDHMAHYHEAQSTAYRVGTEAYTWHHVNALRYEASRDWMLQLHNKLVELQKDLRQALER